MSQESIYWVGPDKDNVVPNCEVEVHLICGDKEKFLCGGYVFHNFGFVRFCDNHGKDIRFIRSDSIMKLVVTRSGGIGVFE